LAKYADEPEPAPSKPVQPEPAESAEPGASTPPAQAQAETPELPKADNAVAKPPAKSVPKPVPKPSPTKELDIPL
jgi:hypothetical protein